MICTILKRKQSNLLVGFQPVCVGHLAVVHLAKLLVLLVWGLIFMLNKWQYVEHSRLVPCSLLASQATLVISWNWDKPLHISLHCAAQFTTALHCYCRLSNGICKHTHTRADSVNLSVATSRHDICQIHHSVYVGIILGFGNIQSFLDSLASLTSTPVNSLEYWNFQSMEVPTPIKK